MPAVLEPARSKDARLGGGGSSSFNCSVVVLDDNHNTFEHVIITFCKVLPAYNPEKAYQVAYQIHTCGEAVVWEGSREAGELYVEQLTFAGLRADLR